MTKSLRNALEDLDKAAAAAGVDPAAARSEGIAVAASVAEPARGAFIAWGEQTDVPGGATAFFDAASRGRRFRSAPTDVLAGLVQSNPAAAQRYADALAEVAIAASNLGEPHPQVAMTATTVGGIQRAAVAGTPPPQPEVPTAPTTPSPGQPAMPDPSWISAMADRSAGAAGAVGDFTSAAPGILADVLGRLRQTQDRMREAGMPTSSPFDLSGVDPHTSGAFGSLADSTAPRPAAPTSGAAPEQAGTAAPPQAAEPTGETPAEPEAEPEPEKSLEELLADLDGLIGLASVKEEIHRQSAILRVQGLRQAAGLTDPTITRHLIFVGNPGTGKTTVARLVGGIYRALGLLSKGQLIEVDRSELVAGYLGQTAIKTSEVCQKANGGVLFIDEAYSLSGDQYGEEAINTLVKEMEDNRHDLVVIVAGYPRPMEKFIAENPGLNSRFRTTIEFDDYSDDELVGIFESMASKADYDITPEAVTAFRVLLAKQTRDESFGNGRFARNVFEAAIGRQAWRLRDVEEPSIEQLRTIDAQDVAVPADQDPVAWPVAEETDDQSPSDATGGDTNQAPEETGADESSDRDSDAQVTGDSHDVTAESPNGAANPEVATP